MTNETSQLNLGTVVSVRGSVVDIRFTSHLPVINTLLYALEGKIAIEVLSQLDAQQVRGIALTPTQGLARGVGTGYRPSFTGTGGQRHSIPYV